MAAAASASFKLVLLGEGRVGKTSIVLKFVRGAFDDKQVTSSDASCLERTVSVGGSVSAAAGEQGAPGPLGPSNAAGAAVPATYKLNIWDTAGQERFHALTPLYYRDAGELESTISVQQRHRRSPGPSSRSRVANPRKAKGFGPWGRGRRASSATMVVSPLDTFRDYSRRHWSDGALLVYDITDVKSFERVKHWVTELRRMASPSIQLVICGNKADLERSRKVDNAAAAAYAKEMGASHFLTSAKMGDGLKEAFADLTKREACECGRGPRLHRPAPAKRARPGQGVSQLTVRALFHRVPPLLRRRHRRNQGCWGVSCSRGSGRPSRPPRGVRDGPSSKGQALQPLRRSRR
ncbi:RAB21 [Symbiodinium sp. KB8]|nr:RAB21 [Symbiodinium sp. KB8]